MFDKDNNNPITLKCRHCGTENESDKEKLIYTLDKCNCKNCGGNLFLDKGEKFENLSPSVYEHPLEKEALRTLRSIPGLDTAIKSMLRNFTDRYFKIFFMQNYVKVSETHLSTLYKKVERVAKIFGLSYVPELYVVQSGFSLNAFVMGIDKAFIGISSYMLNLLTDEEIDSVIAHEISHIKSDHILYKTLANILGVIGVAAATIGLQVGAGIGGVGDLLMYPLKQALRYWDRCSELSADRAEILVSRDYELFVSTRMKLASGMPKKYKDEMSIKEFEKQAEVVYSMERENFLDRIAMMFQESNETHPFPVWRIGAIREWLRDENFYEVLQGRQLTTDTKNEAKAEFNIASIQSDFDKFIKDIKDFFGFK